MLHQVETLLNLLVLALRLQSASQQHCLDASREIEGLNSLYDSYTGPAAYLILQHLGSLAALKLRHTLQGIIMADHERLSEMML